MNLSEYLEYVGDEWAKGWLQRQKTEEKGVWVSSDYMDIVGGNPYDAMVLAQVLFWHGLDREKLQPRISHQHKNHLWIVKTYKEWANDLRFNSDRTVKQCFVRLAALGVVIKEKHKSPYHGGQIALFIRVNWPCLKQLLSTLNNSVGGTPDVQPEKTSHVQPEGTPHVSSGKTSNVLSLPESTSKNTTKTTTEQKQKAPAPLPTKKHPGFATVKAAYENNIAKLVDVSEETLDKWLEIYPVQWLLDSFDEAVTHNKRNLAYCRSILERWGREGRGKSKPTPLQSSGKGSPAPDAPRPTRSKFTVLSIEGEADDAQSIASNQ